MKPNAKPQDRQLVLATLRIGVKLVGRYYGRCRALRGRPGYELRVARGMTEIYPDTEIVDWEAVTESRIA